MTLATQKISRSFSERAHEYNKFALLQKEVSYHLCELIADVGFGRNSSALDIGCGTGFIASNFRDEISFTQTDISKEMCNIASEYGKAVQADMVELPFEDEQFDLITSSMALQWSANIEKTFAEIFRVARKNALIALAIPTKKSLKELRSTFANIDRAESVNILPSTSEIFENIYASKFDLVNHIMEQKIVAFDDVRTLLRSFKNIGAGTSKLNAKPITKKQLNYVVNNYPRVKGKPFISWQIDYFLVRKR